MQLINLHAYSFAIALVAFVYSQILTDSGMILNFIYRVAEKKLHKNIFKPLIGCFKCVAGQVALWFFLYKFQYNLFYHVYFVCLTIFISVFINFIYGRIKND